MNLNFTAVGDMFEQIGAKKNGETSSRYSPQSAKIVISASGNDFTFDWLSKPTGLSSLFILVIIFA